MKYNFQYMQNLYTLAKTVLINHMAKFQLYFFRLNPTRICIHELPTWSQNSILKTVQSLIRFWI